MIRDGGGAWRAIGWTWGGNWRSLKDYMHFSANGL
jgi:D-alanyl-D-alanine carboxypeptidase